jgi:hypothetical protein
MNKQFGLRADAIVVITLLSTTIIVVGSAAIRLQEQSA